MTTSQSPTSDELKALRNLIDAYKFPPFDETGRRLVPLTRMQMSVISECLHVAYAKAWNEGR
jgi:hypothetical protein